VFPADDRELLRESGVDIVDGLRPDIEGLGPTLANANAWAEAKAAVLNHFCRVG